ncbi:MAG: peroxidase-related enzyme [Rhizobiales bacterium]|nr:peroxidase-related enzyme [Hyphomicrobiales bacterium]
MATATASAKRAPGKRLLGKTTTPPAKSKSKDGARDSAKRIANTAKPQADDTPIIALDLPRGTLSPAMLAYFRKCEEKLGFIPNVLLAYAFDNAKLEAFVAMYNDLMLGPSGLSKLEREMIAVAVSSQNRCYYCLTAHGAAVRQYAGNPILGEQMVMNYRAARLDKRQRAMLDFAVRLTMQPWAIEEPDRERLRRAGFNDRDIWDISAVVGFFNMSNRVASATDMRPNTVYHQQAR